MVPPAGHWRCSKNWPRFCHSGTNLAGSNFNLNTGATNTGASTAKLVIDGTASVNASSITLPIPTAVTGELTGSGNVTASSALTVSGTMNGTGTVTVPTGASLTLNSGTLYSGALINNGPASVVADTTPYVGTTAKLVNAGTITFAVGSGIYGGCYQAATNTTPAVPAGEFDNTGAIVTNGTATGPVRLGDTNQCLVTQDSGSLNVASGETNLAGSNFNRFVGAAEGRSAGVVPGVSDERCFWPDTSGGCSAGRVGV